MYLSKDIIERSYRNLYDIDPESDGTDGKRATERVSALRYFLATFAGLTRNSSSSLSLSTQERANRRQFIVDVGDVVRLNLHQEDGGPYTNNFKHEASDNVGFGVTNNFLTTTLSRDGDYPTRPRNSALLVKKSSTLEPHVDWQDHLLNYGNFNSYSPALALWLCRFEDIGGPFQNENDYISSVNKKLKEKYGAQIAGLLTYNKSTLLNLIRADQSTITLSQDPIEDLSFLCSDTEATPAAYNQAHHIGENLIFYGAPGTGKSHKIEEKIQKYEANQAARVVFHNEYQNSDFIGSLKPSMEGEKICYRFVPGPFLSTFVKSIKNKDLHYFLVIEELNRANAAAVFGEVFQLMDRASDGRSEYSITPDPQVADFLDNELKIGNGGPGWDGTIYLPGNFSIFATVNSADQGVLPMDSAFKRRWRFEYIPIDFESCAQGEIDHAGEKYEWRSFAQSVNKLLIRMNVEEDRLLGPFFLNSNDLKVGRKAVAGKLFVYLWDDVLRHLPRSHIFDCDDRSFGDIYKDYMNDRPVFSDALIEELNASFET